MTVNFLSVEKKPKANKLLKSFILFMLIFIFNLSSCSAGDKQNNDEAPLYNVTTSALMVEAAPPVSIASQPNPLQPLTDISVPPFDSQGGNNIYNLGGLGEFFKINDTIYFLNYRGFLGEQECKIYTLENNEIKLFLDKPVFKLDYHENMIYFIDSKEAHSRGNIVTINLDTLEETLIVNDEVGYFLINNNGLFYIASESIFWVNLNGEFIKKIADNTKNFYIYGDYVITLSNENEFAFINIYNDDKIILDLPNEAFMNFFIVNDVMMIRSGNALIELDLTTGEAFKYQSDRVYYMNYADGHFYVAGLRSLYRVDRENKELIEINLIRTGKLLLYPVGEWLLQVSPAMYILYSDGENLYAEMRMNPEDSRHTEKWFLVRFDFIDEYNSEVVLLENID